MKNPLIIYRVILKLGIILVFSLNYQVTYSQDMKHGIDYQYNFFKYIDTDKIIWYGWDFSNFKITDHNAYGYMVKNEYIPIWLDKLNDMVSENRVRRNLDKQEVIADLASIQNLYKSVDDKTFESSGLYVISIDSLKSIVKRYVLPQTEGVGFVIIIETMNKPQRYVTGYLTFFDIKTREVVWATKMKGLPGGKWGAELYYRNGLIELYDYFIARYYHKVMRKAMKYGL